VRSDFQSERVAQAAPRAKRWPVFISTPASTQAQLTPLVPHIVIFGAASDPYGFFCVRPLMRATALSSANLYPRMWNETVDSIIGSIVDREALGKSAHASRSSAAPVSLA